MPRRYLQPVKLASHPLSNRLRLLSVGEPEHVSATLRERFHEHAVQQPARWRSGLEDLPVLQRAMPGNHHVRLRLLAQGCGVQQPAGLPVQDGQHVHRVGVRVRESGTGLCLQRRDDDEGVRRPWQLQPVEVREPVVLHWEREQRGGQRELVRRRVDLFLLQSWFFLERHCVAQSTTCTPGATQCSGKQVQTCELVNGAYQWVTTQACTCTVTGGTASCCTPEPVSTTCGTNTCGTVTNNCGQTISCGTCNGACTDNVCTPYTITLTRAGATIGASISATAESTLSLQAIVTPSAQLVASGLASGIVGDTISVNVPAMGTIGNLYLTAYDGTAPVATRTITITPTCNPGDACYCKDSCTTTTPLTPKPGYCQQGTCGTCPDLFNGTACVQCTPTDTSRCTATIGCQSATCKDFTCATTTLPDGTACGSGLYCATGVCTGCATDQNGKPGNPPRAIPPMTCLQNDLPFVYVADGASTDFPKKPVRWDHRRRVRGES